VTGKKYSWLFLFILFGLFVSGLNLVSVSACYCMTLDECVALALKNNPDLQKEQMNLRFAQKNVDEQKSRNFGKIDFVSAYNHYNLPRTLTPLTPGVISSNPAAVPTTEDLFVVGVAYEVVLFTGFSQTRGVEISRLEKEMAGVALRLKKEQLIYNVKTLYVNILSLQAQEEAQASYVEALQRLYDDVTLEMQFGRKARIDQLKAASDLQNGKAVQEQIAANIKILKGSLLALLNVKTLSPLQSVDFPPEAIVPVTDDVFEFRTDLLRLQESRLALQKSSKLIDQTESVLYPRLVFNSSYGQNFGPNDPDHKNNGDWEQQEVWQAGLNLRWNIFDFGGNNAKVQKARIMKRQSRYAQIKTELELNRQLQEAVVQINSAVIAYNSAEMEHAMTSETETIEQLRFEQGTADINDLLYARARNQLALSRFIGARFSYETACFYLDYLLEKGESQ
jgi:outer membrane protein TolC